MEIFFGIILIILSLCSFIITAFLLFGQPLWAIIDCASSEKLNSNEKTTWLILIILLGVLGWFFCVTFWLGPVISIAYALLISKSIQLKKWTKYSLIAMFTFYLVGFIAMFFVPTDVKTKIQNPIREKIESIKPSAHSGNQGSKIEKTNNLD